MIHGYDRISRRMALVMRGCVVFECAALGNVRATFPSPFPPAVQTMRQFMWQDTVLVARFIHAAMHQLSLAVS